MKSHNILRNASIAADSANFWWTTKNPFDVRRTAVTTRSLSAYTQTEEQDARAALAICRVRPPAGGTTELDQQTVNVFEGPNLQNGDMMVILSSTEALQVYNPVVNGSILAVAQMPTDMLEQFANLLGVSFTPSEYGVYSKIYHPNSSKQL